MAMLNNPRVILMISRHDPNSSDTLFQRDARIGAMDSENRMTLHVKLVTTYTLSPNSKHPHKPWV